MGKVTDDPDYQRVKSALEPHGDAMAALKRLKRRLRPLPDVVVPEPDPVPVVPSWPRSFATSSWWNTPIPGSVAVDPRSDAMVLAQARSCPPPTVKPPTGEWAIPWSEVVALDSPVALVTIWDARGHAVTVYVNVTIGQMGGDDGAVVFRDWVNAIEVSTFETVIPRHADSTVDTSSPITCTGFACYGLSSDGIAKQAGGITASTGHRGVPPSSMALHPDDHGIQHRLKVALGEPADAPGPNFPMYGIESPRSGAIPEGAVIRLKAPDPANAVQVAAHDYGFIIGDTARAGKAALKTVQGGTYAPETLAALDGLTWDDWEVMTLGWR